MNCYSNFAWKKDGHKWEIRTADVTECCGVINRSVNIFVHSILWNVLSSEQS